MILLEFQASDSRHSVLIEDNDRVAYTYLRSGGEIIGDLWLV